MWNNQLSGYVGFGPGPKSNSPDAKAEAPWVWALRAQTHGALGPICLTKLEVAETIGPNPKANLLMTVCLSQISSERAICPVTSSALPSFIRNQDSNAPKQIIQVKVFKIHPFYLKHILWNKFTIHQGRLAQVLNHTSKFVSTNTAQAQILWTPDKKWKCSWNDWVKSRFGANLWQEGSHQKLSPIKMQLLKNKVNLKPKFF